VRAFGERQEEQEEGRDPAQAEAERRVRQHVQDPYQDGDATRTGRDADSGAEGERAGEESPDRDTGEGERVPEDGGRGDGGRAGEDVKERMERRREDQDTQVATQGQFHGFFHQLPYKRHLNRVASAGN
jgi:hypothetical protein